jgi:uncharacterized protein DUF3455
MRITITRILTTSALLLAVGHSFATDGAPGGPPPAPYKVLATDLPDVPATLRPPAGQVVYLEALATGVQIYQCMSKPDDRSTYEWAFRAPEATLADRLGRSLGKHYAGPTWESLDGSTVVGEATARDPGPKRSAIPWLLLKAKATTGGGTFGQAKSIQRLQTVGGVAPSEPCSATNAQQIARIPYTASYYFYRAGP